MARIGTSIIQLRKSLFTFYLRSHNVYKAGVTTLQLRPAMLSINGSRDPARRNFQRLSLKARTALQ